MSPSMALALALALGLAVAVAACGARPTVTPASPTPAIDVAPATAESTVDEPLVQARGVIEAHVLDEQGGSHGPLTDSTHMESCHRRGSTSVGWALIRFETSPGGQSRSVTIVESDGVTKSVLDCLVDKSKNAQAQTSDRHIPKSLLYVRLL